MKIYNSKTKKASKEEIDEYNKKIKKEIEKYKRDSKCDGIDEKGNYTSLHYRYN